MTMRVLSMAAVLVLASAANVAAQPRPVQPEFKWCYIELPFYLQHCVYRSIEECRLEIPGMGGFCNLNPRYVEPAPATQTTKRKRPAR
jgi:hypothetical protein